MARMARMAGLVAIAVLVAGCSSEGKDDPLAAVSRASSAIAAATGTAVTIESSKFSPSPLEIASGTKITVTNKGSITHTFSSVSGPASFDAGRLDEGISKDVTFDAAGTYEYQCNIHPRMKGTVVVS